MAFRLTKRIKIAPGININVGLGGVSASVGPRGAKINLSKRGVRGTVGIPGTGLSYSQNLSTRRAQERQIKQAERQLKQQQRLEQLSQATLRLDKDTGSVTVLSESGYELLGKDRSLVFENQAWVIYNWLEDQADDINGDVDLLEDIYLDSPNISNHPEYQPIEYEIDQPVMPVKSVYPPQPVKEQLEKLGFFAKLFKSKRIAHEAKLAEIDNKHGINIETWNQKCEWIDQKHSIAMTDYAAAMLKWNSAKSAHDASEQQKKESFRRDLEVDTELMEEVLTNTFEQIEWPRETIIDFHIADNGTSVWLDVDLPEIEDMPQKIATVAATRRKLNIKNKGKKQLQLEYSKHIHGIGMRLACYVFASLPKAEEVTISGYSQRLSTKTGITSEDYLYSVKFTRDILKTINFDKLEDVDPVEMFDLFKKRRKLTATGIFTPIVPFDLMEAYS